MKRGFAEVLFLTKADDAVAKQLVVGNRFLFLDAKTIAALPDDCNLDCSLEGRAIVALPEAASVSLAGMLFEAALPDPISWLSLTCDRMVYDELNDPINFLVVSATAKNESVEIKIHESGREIESRSVRLNGAGVGTLSITGMPVGEYEAIIEGRGVSRNCRFTIARYRLAALVADLESFQMVAADKDSVETTKVKMQLKTFGVPLTGRVRCDLVEGNQVLVSRTVDVASGSAEVDFPFQGTGALSVNVQVEDDPSKTATVILQGSSKVDREGTVFSQFGAMLEGSLAPSKNSKPIRGIQFVETGICSSPIHVVPTACGVRIETGLKLDELVIQIVDAGENPLGRLKVHRRTNFAPDDHWEISFESPACHLGAAAFVDGKPWEQWGSFVKDSHLSPAIEIKKPQQGGEKTMIFVSSDGGSFAYVIVKDARLPQAESTGLQLSRCIRDCVSDLDRTSDAIALCVAQRRQSVEGLLLAQGTISLEQLHSAKILSASMGIGVCEALVRCDSITEKQAAEAYAEFFQITLLDGSWPEHVPESVFELMPESVARENIVFPIAQNPNGSLLIAMVDPSDIHTIETLRFIMNRQIEVVVATRDQIYQAINYAYGQIEGESADSLLQEFTDTAVDFTETAMFALSDMSDDLAGSRFDLDSTDDHVVKKLSGSDQNETKYDSEKPGDVLFAQLVPLVNGNAEINLDIPLDGEAYSVCATVFSDDGSFDWAIESERFINMPDVFVSLDLPKFIHPKDAATGRVYSRLASGSATVTVFNDKKVVATFEAQSGELQVESFVCKPGNWRATLAVEDSEELKTVKKEVFAPGVSKTIRTPTAVLKPGDSQEFASDVRKLEILPGFDSPFKNLAKATSNYQHLCCEQTAAKIRATVFIYITSDANSPAANAAEASIIAGVNRMQTMWIQGKGFMAYPRGARVPNEGWGRLAAKHLLYLSLLGDLAIESASLRSAIDCGLKMAHDVHQESKAEWTQFRYAEDAYRVVRFSENKKAVAAAKAWIREAAAGGVSEPVRGFGKSVWSRINKAYLAAGLMLRPEATDIEVALRMANEVLAAIDENGRLYSTIDSVAAITMLHELRTGLGSADSDGDHLVLVNGEETPVDAIADLQGTKVIEATDRPLIIRTEKLVETSWTDFKSNLPVEVSLLRRGQHELSFTAGDAIELQVELTDGYRFGDFLDVCLPDSLSRVFGGSQVKQFAVDFEGESSIKIQLVATGVSLTSAGEPGPHHFAIIVRNMYDEERVACPAFLRVNVAGQAALVE